LFVVIEGISISCSVCRSRLWYCSISIRFTTSLLSKHWFISACRRVL